LPWSTCAIIAMLRMSLRSSIAIFSVPCGVEPRAAVLVVAWQSAGLTGGCSSSEHPGLLLNLPLVRRAGGGRGPGVAEHASAHLDLRTWVRVMRGEASGRNASTPPSASSARAHVVVIISDARQGLTRRAWREGDRVVGQKRQNGPETQAIFRPGPNCPDEIDSRPDRRSLTAIVARAAPRGPVLQGRQHGPEEGGPPSEGAHRDLGQTAAARALHPRGRPSEQMDPCSLSIFL